MATDVFRDTFMRTMAHIQAAEVHSYCQRDAFFRPVYQSLHKTPLQVHITGGWVSREGTTCL
jgi:hypothetical protein